jgi:hypothetical protein
MRNVLGKTCRENENAYFTFNIYIFFENRAVYEIMSNDVVEPEGPQMPIWHMRVACWVSKAARSHAHAHPYVPGHLRARAHSQKCVMIVAFLRKQWFCERASLLRILPFFLEFK